MAACHERRGDHDRQHQRSDGGPCDERTRRRAHELQDEQTDDGRGAAPVADQVDALEQLAKARAGHRGDPEDQRHKRRVSNDDHLLIIIAGLEDSRFAALDGIAARIVDAIALDESVSADAAVFLLRHYVTSERDDLRDPLGVALAHALAAARRDTSALARATWLTLFVEASAIADDERILQAARELVTGLRA